MEEEKTAVDTIEVFDMSTGLGNGEMFTRDINRGGSTEGAINTYTLLGSYVLALAARTGRKTKLN